MEIEQAEYKNIEVDVSEKDVVILVQRHSKYESDVVLIERENIPQMIAALQSELTKKP
mgnify:CR=1 FL=1